MHTSDGENANNGGSKLKPLTEM